jgi:hypothetical protein
MPRGNPSPKLSITVPPDIAEAVASVATEEGISVSEWFAEAARRQLKLRDARDGVRGIEAMHGPPSEASVAWARKALSAASPTVRRPRSA